jgi:hypothetical protein
VRIVLAVLATGLIARLLSATVLVPRAEQAAHLGTDPDRYAQLAASLVDRGELGFLPPGASPTSVRGPAFPGWLAVGMIFRRSLPWLAFWSSLPGLLAACVIAAVLERSHGAAAALAGGLIAAAHPLACFVSGRLLPDEAYGALLFLGVASWSRVVRSPLLGRAALAGAALGAASLIRVTALGVLAMLIVIGLLAGVRRRAATVVLAIAAVLPVGAWALRTSRLAGRPALVESLAGYNFWLGESAERYGFAPSFAESRREAHALMTEEAGTAETSASFWYATLTPREAPAFDAKLRRAAWTLVARRPWHMAKRFVHGRVWFWIRAESEARTWQYAAIALPIVAFGAIGLMRLARAPVGGAIPAGWIASVVILHAVLYAPIWPMARYSVQIYPFMSYLSGIGMSALLPRFVPAKRSA